MQYTSLSRTMRGFSYQSDFATREDWQAAINFDRSKNREIEWSLLLRTNGEVVWRYRRGMGYEPASLP